MTHEALTKTIIRHRCDNCRGLDETEINQPVGCWNRIVVDRNSCRCEVVGAKPGDGTLP